MTKIRKANGEYIEVEMQPYQAQPNDPDIPDPTPTIEDRLAKVEEDSGIIRAILLGEGE